LLDDEFVERLHARMEREETNSELYFEKNDLSLIKLHSSIGSKPTSLDLKYDLPNVWLSIGNVADEISNLSETYTREIALIKNHLSQVNSQSIMDLKLKQAMQPLEAKLL